MPSRHPSYEMLRAAALGDASHGVGMLVATHAAYCAACRDEIGRIEALGAALSTLGAVAMRAGALEATLARLDAAAPAEPAPCAADPLLPAPLAAVTGPFGDLRWRFVMPGVSKVDLPAAPGESAMLLRVRPGVAVPQHTHTAPEATLVLCGGLADRGAVYRRGDVALADDHDDHRPRAEPGADCVCLAVTSGALRFTGAFGRALNLFAE